MKSKLPDPMALWTQPSEAFKFWLSFSPMAPFFGVKWQFADSMEAFLPGSPVVRDVPPTETAPAPTAVSRVAGVMADAATEVAKPKRAAARKKPSAKAAKAAEEMAAPEPAPASLEGTVVAIEEAVKNKAAAPALKKAEPAAESAPEPSADGRPASLMDAAPAEPDDLKMIKGIGPGLESKLNALGIYTFEQMADFSDANLIWIDDSLTSFKGRCFRDDWVGQAKSLLG